MQRTDNLILLVSVVIRNDSTNTLSLFGEENLHFLIELEKNLNAADTPNGREVSAVNANALFKAGLWNEKKHPLGPL